jgi:hypothetical protein
MALDKNDLLSLVSSNLPDNTAGEITPAKIRQVDEQIISASLNIEEESLQALKSPLSFPNKEQGYALEGSFISLVDQAGVEDSPSTISFGVGGNSDNNHVSIASNGEVTVNTAGYYNVKQRFRVGRSGASGVSELFFWAEISTDGGTNWNVTGNSIDVQLNSADEINLVFDSSFLNLPAGVKLRNRFARSSTGNDSGGLQSSVPSATLIGLGVPTAPSAQITIYKADF